MSNTIEPPKPMSEARIRALRAWKMVPLATIDPGGVCETCMYPDTCDTCEYVIDDEDVFAPSVDK